MTDIKAYFYNEKTQKFIEANIKAKEKTAFYVVDEIENRPALIKEDNQIESIFQRIIIYNLPKTDLNKLSLTITSSDESLFFAFCDLSVMGKSDFLHKVQDKLEHKRRLIHKRLDILNDTIHAVAKLESESFIEEHPNTIDLER